MEGAGSEDDPGEGFLRYLSPGTGRSDCHVSSLTPPFPVPWRTFSPSRKLGGRFYTFVPHLRLVFPLECSSLAGLANPCKREARSMGGSGALLRTGSAPFVLSGLPGIVAQGP